jgi:chromosome segregation ATPase
MIMTQSYGGIIGFVLFGAMVFYEQCWEKEREFVNLTTQIQQSDQVLTKKQQEIVALTEKLTSIEEHTQETQRQFQQEISHLQTINTQLQQTAKTLSEEQKKLVLENQTLAELDKTSHLQIEGLKKGSEALGRRIQAFIEQNQKFLPQINRLSDISHHIEASEQSFQSAIEKDLQAFTEGLKTWKKQTDSIISENQLLGKQIGDLKTAMGEGQKTFEQFALISQKFDRDSEIGAQQESRIAQLTLEITQLQAKLSENRITMEVMLGLMKAEREKRSTRS